MSRPFILITGFGPFPRLPVNPSGALAERVAASPRLRGFRVRALVLRTAYAAIEAELAPALAERPDAVLMIGVARRATRVRVEGRALNRASRLAPDAAGRTAGRIVLDPAGPSIRRSAAAVPALVALRARGVPATASLDAGRYLCNAGYYRTLGEDCPALFLHIPMPPLTRRPRKPGPRQRGRLADLWADGFAEVARTLTIRARGRRVSCSSSG